MNTQKKGRLIVIEGVDGSGKTTQFELLYKYLLGKGIDVRAITFPDYSQPSSSLIKSYLAGEYGTDPSEVNAYAASSFYAVDRYASYKKFWKNDYMNGSLILSARYTTSNAVHQMNKLDFKEWDNYLDWLNDYEYNKLGLPAPDIVLFLDMPLDISEKLLYKRYSNNSEKLDIHEKHRDYQLKCREAAEYSAKKLGWKIISCTDKERILSIEEIHKKIIDTVSFLIY